MRTLSTVAERRYRPPMVAPVVERTDADDFDVGLASLAKQCMAIPDLNEQERSLLSEFARGASVDGEPRYRMKTLRAFARITARSRDLAVRGGLPELVRAEVLRAETEPAADVTEAFDEETPAPGLADPLQREFEQNPNPATWARCRDALIHQVTASRRALDAVLRWKTP